MRSKVGSLSFYLSVDLSPLPRQRARRAAFNNRLDGVVNDSRNSFDSLLDYSYCHLGRIVEIRLS